MSQAEDELSPEKALEILKRQLGGQGPLVAAIVMLTLTLAWTAMRVAARRIGGHKFLAADYFYFASQLAFIGVFTCAIISELPSCRVCLQNLPIRLFIPPPVPPPPPPAHLPSPLTHTHTHPHPATSDY